MKKSNLEALEHNKYADALQKDGLRGDYSAMRSDYTVDQNWHSYTSAEHDLFKRLYERQIKLLPQYACKEVLDGIKKLDCPDRIPRFEDISIKLRRKTGWELVAVPGLVPDTAFFNFLANRKFPITVWLRKPEEFNYIVEPDLFHDLFGHVPMLFNPSIADYMQAYGEGGLKAQKLKALSMLSRLYWYTIEFGLIKTPEGMRAFGAGILSSSGELVHSIESPKSNREPFDLELILRTEYRIDDYQDTYFVLESFEDLVEKTSMDFTPIYERVRKLPVRYPPQPQQAASM